MAILREVEPEGGLRAPLIEGLSEFRALPEPFQESLQRPTWGALRASNFFLWQEFADLNDLHEGEPERSLAAAVIRTGVPGKLLLAALDFRVVPARLLRLRAGNGVRALADRLSTLESAEGEIVLASERERGSIGWLAFEGEGRRTYRQVSPPQE